jgi:isopenicillin-N epimerase
METAAFLTAAAAAAVALKARGAAAVAAGGGSDADARIRRYGFGAAVRPLFPTDFRYIHLNHGSYGVAPWRVMAAARRVMEGIEAFPDAFMRRSALGRFAAAADAVADFVAAPRGSVVFVENATAGVNAVLRSLVLRPGDQLAINNHTYNACKNAALDVAARAGASVVVQTVPVPDPATPPAAADDTIVAAFDAFLAAHPAVKFALVDHITSPTAIVMPVARLAAAAHARGVKIMVDGAHAPGQLDLDVGAIGADWYTGNLHKWVFALKGTAFLHAGAAVVGDTAPVVTSHFWKRGLADRFFMQGTNDQSRYLTAPDGIAFARDCLGGFPAMRAHNAALADAGAAVLERAWGTHRLTAHGTCAPFLVPVELPLDWRAWVRRPAPGGAPGAEADAVGLPAAEAEAALSADEGFNERVANALFFGYGIQTALFTWRVGGAVRLWLRISAQVYNTLDDYRALAAAVLDLKAKTEGGPGKGGA